MTKPHKGRSTIEVTHVGEYFALGRSRDIRGIWTKDAVTRRRPGPPIEAFPLTDEAGQAAWARFSTWEPNAQPVEYRPPTRPDHRLPYRALGIAVVVVLGAVVGTGIAARRSGAHRNATAPRSKSRSRQLIGTPDPTAPAPVGTGYLARGNGFVDYIQWSNTRGQLSGSAQEVTVTGQPPSMTTANQTLTVSGTLHGSTLGVTFEGQPTTFGTIAGNSFTLDFPQADGSLAPIPFSAAPATAFNSALADLNQRVTQANTQEASAQALQQQQATIAQDAANVNTDIADLPSAQTAMANDVTTMEGGSLQTLAADVSTTIADGKKVVAEAKQPGADMDQVCTDADGVQSEADGVASDIDSMTSDVDNITSDLSTLGSQIAGLNADFAQLRNDEAKLPGYQPTNPPPPRAVSAAVATAKATVSNLVAKANSDIDQANAGGVAATNYANAAVQTNNCSGTMDPPDPIAHIS